MSISSFRYSQRPVDIVGTPILVKDPATFSPADQTSSGILFTGENLANLKTTQKYNPKYPLLMKLFCKDVVTDRTGEFKVTISGSLSPTTTVTHRQDTRNFGITWNLGNTTDTLWDTVSNSDATVTLTPIPPMTAVKMNCLLGIATDNLNRAEIA